MQFELRTVYRQIFTIFIEHTYTVVSMQGRPIDSPSGLSVNVLNITLPLGKMHVADYS